MLNSKLNLALVAALVLVAAAPALAKTSSSSEPEVQKFVAVLKSDAAQKDKADACRELARIGTKDAVASLAALLGDEKLSHMARYGLETIPGSAVDKAFREALPKLQGRSLVGVIGSMGVRRDTGAVKPLAAFLSNSDPNVAQAAARALGKIGTAPAAKAIQQGMASAPAANQLAFSEGLFRCAERLTAEGQRRKAMGIYDTLRNTQSLHQVRTAALRGAILTRQKDGIPTLLEAIRGSDFSQFDAAVRTSQEMPGAEVTQALVNELPKLPADKQIVLIQALAKRGDPKTLPALFAAAKNCEKPVRLEAIRALPQIADASAVPVLLELLSTSDSEIARAAQENLAGLPGPEADAAVMQLLANSDPKKRVTALELIARRRMISAVPALFQTAAAPDQQVRVVAIKKLGELAGANDLPSLLDLLGKAKNSADMDATEQALGSLCAKAATPDACVDRLTARMGQSQPAQKCALLRILTGAGGTKALGFVRASVKDSSPEVRTAAIRALGNWNTADAAPDLLELARTSENASDKMVSLRGYLGFAKHSDVSEAQRLNMCREASALIQKPEEKKLLLAALGDITSTNALPLIQPYLEDEATKEEASNAIVGISDKLLKRNNAARFAPSLVTPLEKASQATANSDLADRAKKLLEQARSKAEQK